MGGTAWSASILAVFLTLKFRPDTPLGLGWLLIPVVFLAAAMKVMDYSLIYIRGYLGERRVFEELFRLPDSYWVFNDVQIEVRGKSAQVDHVLVSPYGLWCIETKSLRGTIYGKERDRRWTQVKRSDTGRIFREQFYNPVSQNAAHCCRLAEYLKGRIGLELPIRSVVVFAGARLQVEATTPVMRLAELRQVIEASDTVP